MANNFPTIRPSLLLDFANSKVLDPRISFTAASARKYYDGITTAKAEENLLRYSQEFDNAVWTTITASVDPNSTTAPDGSISAYSLIETADNSPHGIYNLIQAIEASYTFSVFLKANTRTFAYLRVGAGAWFNLSSGVVGTMDSGVTADISDEGDGWYRCSITLELSAGSAFPTIFLADADNSDTYSGDGVSGIYVWGAQLEQRDSVTAYIEATSQPITNYIPKLMTAAADVPRFDHDPVTGESLGLLREGGATNLLLYSENFSDGVWVKSALSVSVNQMIAPDGTLGFDALTETTETEQHSLYEIIASLPVGTYTLSAFVSKTFIGNRNFVLVPFSTGGVGGTGAKGVIFNQDCEFVGFTVGDAEPTYKVVDCGDCFRVSVTGYTTDVATAYPVIALRDGTTQSYAGDGVSTMFVWGAQFEAGSRASSYIKTEASQVSRAADVVTMTGTNFSDWYNPAEGTFVVVSEAGNDGGASHGMLSASDGTLGNSINMYRSVNSSVMDFYSGGPQQASFSTTFSLRTALAYRTNDTAAAAGGFLLTDSACIPPSGVDELIIGSTYAGNTYPLNGTIAKIAYYPRRLSDAELQILTA